MSQSVFYTRVSPQIQIATLCPQEFPSLDDTLLQQCTKEKKKLYRVVA